MPVGEDNILGFSNPWYPEGFAHAIPYTLPDETTIQIMPAVYFVATKLAALRSRGMSDIRLSNDLEDIVYVLDNRPALGAEVAAASPAVRSYIATEIRQLLRHPELREAIDCQLPYGYGDERKFIIERRLHSLTSDGR
ncbi:hypothetical protein DNI29_21475 [Hymenobacter sediminis]|uniref:hypothetical protein n=1 Tax=Hymenobacter sediminis TaxID=2218621 RepID=UPI000F50B0EF|nr:hypothetical protein [Hymenobacter sediminis]RPD44285.1 hypothetical protein DNI29_21475 [Hymenobacter sediminis]